MGMFDSFYINCPECGNELEYQSKSGACMLARYGKKPKKGELYTFEKLSADVAIDLQGDIVRCQFCNNRIKLNLDIPDVKNVKAISLGKMAKFRYDGNHNPEHPASIKTQKEMAKIFGKAKRVA